MKFRYLLFLAFLMCFACKRQDSTVRLSTKDTVSSHVGYLIPNGKNVTVETGNTNAPEVIAYAKTLEGIPYKYGSTDPAQGFDCSGFVTYVFNHFGIKVPRTSTDFAYVNHEIDLDKAKPGDLILFTGTDSTVRKVGHMGIILSTQNKRVTFIHSTSGKARGVTESELNTDYRNRYMKTIRIFPDNDVR